VTKGGGDIGFKLVKLGQIEKRRDHEAGED
jgi:hypothetical protein